MSNIIPIVSSSPPPLDDMGAGWDDDNDEDDEFGNFASAPNLGPAAITSVSSFDVNWSKSDLSLPEDEIHNEKSEESRSDENINNSIPSKSAFKDEWLNNNSKRTNSGEGNEFPDFAQFNGDRETDCDQPAKQDCVTSSAEINEHSEIDAHVFACKETNFSNKHPSSDSVSTDHDSFSFAVSKNNESVYSTSSTVDSGVFSTDLSPSPHGTFTSDLYQSTEASHLEKPVAIFNTLEDSLSGDPSDYNSKGDKSLEEFNSDSLHSSPDGNVPPALSQAVESEDWSNFDTALGSKTTSAWVDEKDAKSVNSGCQRNGMPSETGGNPAHSAPVTDVKEFKDSTNTSGEVEGVSNSSSAPFGDSTGERSDLQASRICREEIHADQCHEKISFQSDTSSVAQEDHTNSLNPQSSDVDETNVEMVSGSNVISQENDSAWGDFEDAPCSDENEDVEVSERPCKESQGHEGGVVSENVKSSRNMSDLQITVIQNESETDKMAESDEAFVSKNVSTIDDLSSTTPNSTQGNDVGLCIENVEFKDNSLADPDEEDQEFGHYVSLPDEEVPPITFRTSVCETEEPDADFGFDQGKPPAFHDDDNDDDDFGAFGEADLDDDCKFGEFDSAARPANDVAASRFENDEDNDFGEFGTTDQNTEGEASWADFGQAAPLTVEKEPCGSGDVDDKSHSMASSKAAEQNQSKAQKLERAVVSCFPETVEFTPGQLISNQGSRKNSMTDASDSAPDQSDGLTPLEMVVELGLTNPLEAKQQTWTVVQHPAKKDPKVRLWNNLKDVDSSHALVYSWPVSHCSKEVYGTLHIDTQNVLFSQKKQAVPFFASGLILEPIRGGENKALKHTQSPAGLLDSNRHEQQQTVSTVQDIPPVDFDWSSSGLTNPLTVFKADCQESTRSSLQPLEDILKKSTPTAKLATHEVLSPEALRILEKMPDLSFMQSRVLMFPVKQ
ncbi:unnamed protein product [Lymnaea stagnalis]|uniref:Aftiphilin clathrin-binding box domain-containing protein n=1 Tax=Lymnaea stagnalis TaxID=6523 RepID=A0AAV2HTA8_LYMST